MPDDRRIVHDPIHGSIDIDGFFMDILDRHEMQRLHSIKQLGMGSMVFPGANHTRFEHCMGVYHLAGRMSKALGLNEQDDLTVRAAGFLHDICHPPYSHTMEELMEKYTNKDHMDLARDLIRGTVPTYRERDEDILGGTEPIGAILEANGVSQDEVCDLIQKPRSEMKGNLDTFFESDQSCFKTRDFIHQIIHGPVDADQMDYLMRDAHYTGVTYGAIDIDRLLTQIRLYNDKMALNKGGIVAAESLMVSRSLMYSSVYYHKTVRIVEMMLTKAVEAASEDGLDFSEIYLMNDIDLMSELIHNGGRTASNIARKVLNRRLYKKSYILYSNDLNDDDIETLLKHSGYDKRKRLEQDIADRAGIDVTKVNVDVPSRSTLLSLEKVGKTDVDIFDGNKLRPITQFSPLARSLQARPMFDWAIMISAPKEDMEAVRKAAVDVIGIKDRLSL